MFYCFIGASFYAFIGDFDVPSRTLQFLICTDSLGTLLQLFGSLVMADEHALMVAWLVGCGVEADALAALRPGGSVVQWTVALLENLDLAEVRSLCTGALGGPALDPVVAMSLVSHWRRKTGHETGRGGAAAAPSVPAQDPQLRAAAIAAVAAVRAAGFAVTPAQEADVAKAMQAAVVAAAEGAPAAAGTEGWMNVLLCEGGESSKLGLENPTVTDDGVVLKTESGDRVHVDNSGKRRVILQHLKTEKAWNDHYASLLEACRQYGKPNSILQLQAWHRTVALYAARDWAAAEEYIRCYMKEHKFRLPLTLCNFSKLKADLILHK
jgi:hypothetical protein